MADWSLPTLTSTYINTLAEIKNRDIDLALQFDGTTSTSIPTGAVRWSSAANTWRKWTGSAWGPLSSLFAFPAIQLDWDSRLISSYDNTYRQGFRFSPDRVLRIFSTTGDGSGGAIALSTRNGAGSSDTDYGIDRVYLDRIGQVGIGKIPTCAIDSAGGMFQHGSSSGNNILQTYTNGGAVGLGMWAGGSSRLYSTGSLSISVNAVIGTGIPTGFTDAVTIAGNGWVGFGTSQPGSVVDIRFGTSPAIDNGVGYNALRCFTTSALTSDTGGAISFGGVSTSGGSVSAFGQIAGRKQNAISGDYAGYLQFAVNTGGGAMVERARIDSTGRFGLKTPSPAVSLDINDVDAIRVPAGTTAQRPTGGAGMLRFNSSLGLFEGFSAAWSSFAHTASPTFTGTPAAPTAVAGASTTQLATTAFVQGELTSRQRFLQVAAVATTSGTAVDFTGIPSWAKRVTVMFGGVSTNTTSLKLLQLGDSGGVETTGYTSGASNNTSNSSNLVTSTSGFVLSVLANSTNAETMFGAIVLTNLSSNTWVAQGAFHMPTYTVGNFVAGGKTLSSTLDRIRVTTVNGTDTFDAGSIGLLIEG